MHYEIGSTEYKQLCGRLHELMITECDGVEDPEFQYPQIVLMYEFFRLLRGAAFTKLREPTPDFQKELYRMEDELGEKVKNIKSKIKDSDKATFYLDIMKRSFTL